MVFAYLRDAYNYYFGNRYPQLELVATLNEQDQPKSTALVLARYGHLEAIPDAADRWDVKVRCAVRLATELAPPRDLAVQFRDLATLRTTVELFASVDTLRWNGPRPTFFDLCARLNAPGYFRRARQLADSRAS